mmetsp:Transcript_118262/g.339303  ORF Transcript_118262/g.339303 Transcript_118262/m.339303 type:complete len:94 (+) Transcript_118262:230-511(+)
MRRAPPRTRFARRRKYGAADVQQKCKKERWRPRASRSSAGRLRHWDAERSVADADVQSNDRGEAALCKLVQALDCCVVGRDHDRERVCRTANF